MARSLASVYACFVARFLGGSMRGFCAQSLRLNRYVPTCAVARDGSSVFAPAISYSELVEYRMSVAHRSGSRLLENRVVSLKVDTLTTRQSQVFLASDGCVFVAAGRVFVFTPQLVLKATIGDVLTGRAEGVCADDDSVFVSNIGSIAVYARATGAWTTSFSVCKRGSLGQPANLCFMAANRRLAVADRSKNRVSVFETTGRFVRDVGVGVLGRPGGLACSAADELLVADPANHRVDA